jgi:hypothetical protein
MKRAGKKWRRKERMLFVVERVIRSRKEGVGGHAEKKTKIKKCPEEKKQCKESQTEEK